MIWKMWLLDWVYILSALLLVLLPFAAVAVVLLAIIEGLLDVLETGEGSNG